MLAKFEGNEPDGKVFENYVFTELQKMNTLIYYWRTKSKAEVDFVIERGKEIIPIEAKITPEKRIGRSLQSFIQAYKPKKAIIVNYAGINKKIHYLGCTIFISDIASMKQILQ